MPGEPDCQPNTSENQLGSSADEARERALAEIHLRSESMVEAWGMTAPGHPIDEQEEEESPPD